MYYEAQLRLLRDAFRKCRIQTTIADLDALPEVPTNWDIFLSFTNPAALLRQMLLAVKPATVYRLQDAFYCQYTCLSLPEVATNAVLIIGPYLSAAPTEQQFMEWAELNNVSPRKQKKLGEFYASLPLLPQTSHMFMLVDAFCEQLWGVGGFNVAHVRSGNAYHLCKLLLRQSTRLSNFSDTLSDLIIIHTLTAYTTNKHLNCIGCGAKML